MEREPLVGDDVGFKKKNKQEKWAVWVDGN